MSFRHFCELRHGLTFILFTGDTIPEKQSPIYSSLNNYYQLRLVKSIYLSINLSLNFYKKTLSVSRQGSFLNNNRFTYEKLYALIDFIRFNTSAVAFSIVL